MLSMLSNDSENNSNLLAESICHNQWVILNITFNMGLFSGKWLSPIRQLHLHVRDSLLVQEKIAIDRGKVEGEVFLPLI